MWIPVVQGITSLQESIMTFTDAQWPVFYDGEMITNKYIIYTRFFNTQDVLAKERPAGGSWLGARLHVPVAHCTAPLAVLPHRANPSRVSAMHPGRRTGSGWAVRGCLTQGAGDGMR